MNWDYKHSLSIQIEWQRCNISCGPRRWKWFIFKDVAAYFHYFKVLLISMVLEMTNSHIQEEQAHGGWDFSACQWRRRDHKGLAAYVVQKPKSYLCQAAPHQPRITRGSWKNYGFWHSMFVCLFVCFLDLPGGPLVLPHFIRPSAIHTPSDPGRLPSHPDTSPQLTSFFPDTCWNGEQPFAPWKNTTLLPSSPLRAVRGKHLKYCDHLQ